MTKTEKIAALMSGLTYDEMLDIAETFSSWAGVNPAGADMMARLLSDWARENLPSDTESEN